MPRAFGLLWEADRPGAIWMGLMSLVSAGLAPLQAYVAKLIVDGVLAALRRGDAPMQGLRTLSPYFLATFGLIALGGALARLRHIVTDLSNHKLGHSINRRIMTKALSLDVHWFENPEFYDKMQNARRQSDFRAWAVVNSGFLLVQNVLTLASVSGVLLALNPWLAVLLFGAALPAFVVQTRYSELQFRLQSWRTPETREMTYLEQLLTLDSTVKEVKLFRLGRLLLSRHNETFWRVFDEDAALARVRTLKSYLWGLLAQLSYWGANVWVAWLALASRITIGSMTFYIAIFQQSQGVFQGLLENISQLYEHGLFLENLFSFLGLEPGAALPPPAGAAPLKRDLSRGLEFEGVYFKYPGQEGWAVENFSRVIAPGEKLALVGENGAGKTTLIKLLTGLYAPTRGRILFRGVDLREYPREELHRRIGAIFQDYVHYQMTMRENIAFGAVEALDDEGRMKAAAGRGGADRVAASLAKGFESRLGRWFADGAELSGGQWQKVALGRAFMAEAEVLVLDEPTASLDAESEYEIFRRFQQLSESKIAIIVSHRFSTVRMADRIAVLKRGAIEEIGSHAELVAAGGTYARLFELQAQGYR